jgi:hypothetical protein
MLMGGGFSWNSESAKHPQTADSLLNSKEPALYAISAGIMSEYTAFALTKKPGIFTAESENPFADWNVLIINYVTGDFHVGNNDFVYKAADGTEKILHHRGYNNFLEAMKTCKTFFPSTDKLLITGVSAGAFAVPALAPEIMEFYPDCTDLTVFSDSTCVFLDDGKDAALNVWKAKPELAQAIHSDNISADMYERLFSLKGDSIRYLYSNSCRDYMFVTYQNYISNRKFEATAEQCEAFTPKLKQHIDHLRHVCPTMGFSVNDFIPAMPGSKGTVHCTLTNQMFFEKHSGFSDMQWLFDAVNGKVYDIGLELLA